MRPFREAMRRFDELAERAKGLDLHEPLAFVLATAGAAGRPSSRVVLLKGWDERGFVFYTNLRSRKAAQLRDNPIASMTFFWQELMEQVHIEGRVDRVADADADAYWVTRPRESQLGAWASAQSEALESPEALRVAFDDCERRYEGRDVPRPEHWSGLRLVPDRIEFWESRPHRLHHRSLYEKQGSEWTQRFLFP